MPGKQVTDTLVEIMKSSSGSIKVDLQKVLDQRALKKTEERKDRLKEEKSNASGNRTE